jgi:hypothetical protein
MTIDYSEGEIAQRFCATTARISKDLSQKFGSTKSTEPSGERSQ